ncbi:MAG: hypothetical protein AAFQ82_28520, partial [Myxococcota bacterium]
MARATGHLAAEFTVRYIRCMPSLQGYRASEHVQTAHLYTDSPLLLQDGTSLSSIRVAYETYGELNARGDNAVLVCHALTGDSHVARHDEQDLPGWWDQAVGPGKLVDTDRFFVVCSNVIGSCYGSEGPSTEHPDGDGPWGARF